MSADPCLRQLPYWEWIEHEAALIKTDGCSKVSGAYRRHCRVHDLSYYYARDPVSAYRSYCFRFASTGAADYWQQARPITRAAADAAFRRGMQADSPAGFFSAVALWRWAGLKLAGGKAWDAHRAREAQESP